MIRTKALGGRLRAPAAFLRVCACAGLLALVGAAPPGPAGAEARPAPPAAATRPTSGPAARDRPDGIVRLSLAEGTPLNVLIEFVSQELGVNILYDDALAAERVTVRAPEQFPRAALLGLLESALKARGLALVDAEQEGWKRVVPMPEAARPVAPARPGEGPALPEGAGPSAALTQVFRLEYADAQRLSAAVAPFLSGPGAGSFAVPEQGLLVVTDYASNLKRIDALLRSVDQPAREVDVEFFAVKYADAARLTQQVGQLLKARVRSAGGGDRAAAAVETAYDARTNQIAVIAPKDRLDDARKILQKLDVAVPTEQSPVRFYKLANATAVDVLATIRGLEEEDSDAPRTQTPARPSATRGRPFSPLSDSPGSGYRRGGRDDQQDRPPARGRGPDSGDRDLAAPGEGGAAAPQRFGGPRQSADAPPGLDGEPDLGARGLGATPRESVNPFAAGSAGGPGSGEGAGTRPPDVLRTAQARVTADPNTNSIIVVGPPDVQRLYEQLIRTLDKRRPQVLIEATIVTVDTTDDFELGVEVGYANGRDNQVITFSSFGLSEPDRDTGRLRLIPGTGFNGALLSTEVADVVVRALQSNTRARVTSAPRILVNDNSLGALSSVAQFPFASVNASDTIATTSFGDYVEAGTTIEVTPHISESDYLQLEYSVSLSNFTGPPVRQGETTLPPPRQTNEVQSRVTIPDGATIVVGGLNRRNVTEGRDAIPFLGQIPGLEFLFSNRTRSRENGTLFVFLRPVILRDDKFEDLKFLSERDAREAAVPGDYPASEPLAIP